jgi:hypothetical protein
VPPIGPGSVVIVYLREPREMVWGVLRSLDVSGFQIQGIPLSTFDDWVREIASSEAPSIGLSTVFYPSHRLEKILLDEEVGSVPSQQQKFYRKLQMTVEEYLGTPEA